METIGERIKKIRKEKTMTQEEFANNLGTKRGNIAKYETGDNIPSDAVIALICKTYNVAEAWLRTGEGEPFKEKTLSEEIKDFMNDLDYDDSFKAKLIALLVRMTPDEWEMLEKMARKLGKLDQSTELEGKSTEELEEIYKKEVLSSPSEPGATA